MKKDNVLAKKAEGEITRLAIATIVIAMFTAGLITFIIDVDNSYDVDFDESEFATFNRIAEIQGNFSIPVNKNTEEGSGEISASGDIIEGQAKAGFKSSKILLEIPSILKDLVIDGFGLVQTKVGLPAEFLLGTLALIFIVVASSGIALIFKLRP